MKRLFFIFTLFLIAAGTLSAQIQRIVINTQGGYDVVVEVADRQFAAVTADGYIADIDIPGRIQYHDRFSTFDETLHGRIRRVGNIEFEYFDRFSTFDRNLHGKIRRIGRVSFDYHSNSFLHARDRDGLLSRVGNTRIDYFDNFSFANRGKSGRVQRIGNIRFDYFGENDFSTFDNVNRWKIGMLRSINNHRFDFFRSGPASGSVRPGAGSGAGAGASPGWIRMTGPRTIREDGITINIIDPGQPRSRGFFGINININI